METFFRTHAYLVEHIKAPVRRLLMDEVDWEDRLIGIKGTRGVGKTTFLLQYAKERFGNDRSCLYVNLNNFYFTGHSIVDFADEFRRNGGKVLLLDQIFKYPEWSRELRECYERFPSLKIVFAGCSVMPLDEDNPELNGLVKSYNLRGFSFREFLNLKTGSRYEPLRLEDILSHHEELAREVVRNTDPLALFNEYLHHGFYPFFLEKRNYSENLLKTMNMMIESDILFIKQIDLKYLFRIKRLLYLLAMEEGQAPNVSRLAQEIDTSRATVMNYIKYLYDARLINLLYPKGQNFPKKPARILLHNSNLIHCIKQPVIDEREVMETFFMNTMMKDHWVNQGDKYSTFWVDESIRFRLSREAENIRLRSGIIQVVGKCSIGKPTFLPLWLFGFLY